MSTNEHNVDRIIRIALAVAAVVAAVLLGVSSVVGIVLLVVAAVLLVTAVVGFCPIYRIFGISTCKAPTAQ